jgi:hypothetical protein
MSALFENANYLLTNFYPKQFVFVPILFSSSLLLFSSPLLFSYPLTSLCILIRLETLCGFHSTVTKGKQGLMAWGIQGGSKTAAGCSLCGEAVSGVATCRT